MKIGVVAGNYHEFTEYVRAASRAGHDVEWAPGKTLAKINGEQHFYVVAFEKLIGRRGIELEFYGTYENRDDIADIRIWNVDRKHGRV